MIKFSVKGSKNGRQVVAIGIGLTGENMARLMADEPIVISHDEIVKMMPPGTTIGVDDFEFVIFGGKDEESITKRLSPMFGQNTRFQ